MEQPKTPLPHLEGIWMPSICSFLSDISGSLQISGLHIQQPQCLGDLYIMDLVIQSKKFKAPEIQCINYCRFFFQALTLSDICNAAGTLLAEGIYAGTPSSTQSISLLKEPYQESPNLSTWYIWRRFL